MVRFHFLIFCLLSFACASGQAEEAKFNPNLKLEDLGFAKADTQANPELQKKLEVRSSKLKTHLVTGLVTLGLMGAAVGFSGEVKKNNIHQYLGEAAAVSYWTTFYFSQSAPKPEGVVDRGWNIKIHKALAWVHGPLMVLTPILGIIAHEQLRSGQHHATGIAAAKGPVATLAFLSYAVGASVMLFEF